MFEKGKESPQDQRQVQKKTTIYARKSQSEVHFELAKRLFFLNRWSVTWSDFQGC